MAAQIPSIATPMKTKMELRLMVLKYGKGCRPQQPAAKPSVLNCGTPDVATNRGTSGRILSK
jgi:hypothetical protein